MTKHIKLFIGAVINLVAGIAGFVIWQFTQDSVRMARDLKELAGTIFIVSCIPTLLFFVIWFFGCVKANSQIGVNRPSKWLYFIIGVAVTLAILLICSLMFFPKAILWAVITAAITIAGSLASYLTCEPR